LASVEATEINLKQIPLNPVVGFRLGGMFFYPTKALGNAHDIFHMR